VGFITVMSKVLYLFLDSDALVHLQLTDYIDSN